MLKKRVIVCDYDNPNGYTFPSFGFGSSEKRIWHFAKTVSELKDFEVIITGPLWLPEYVPNAKHFKKRLDINSYQEFISVYGKCDYLFAGHEYFDKDIWVEPFSYCADILLSYQLHPYKYKKISFNAKDKFLFCYSDEMVEMYKEQSPIKALLFHSGVNEQPFFTENPEDYLLWIGRLDRDKAPHYAVLAAHILNKKIKILGKSVYQPEYFDEYKDIFNMPHVEMLGVVSGYEKMKLISEAQCALYTIDKNYSEAGAGVLGEILSSGVPLAGITWTEGGAICEALDSNLLGKVTKLELNAKEKDIPKILSENILYCLGLDRKKVFEIGSQKYDPKKLVEKLFLLIEERRGKH